jgi:hypothetical protein
VHHAGSTDGVTPAAHPLDRLLVETVELVDDQLAVAIHDVAGDPR